MVQDFRGAFVQFVEEMIKNKWDSELVRNHLLGMIEGFTNSPVAHHLRVTEVILNTNNKQRILMLLVLDQTEQLPKSLKMFEICFTSQSLIANQLYRSANRKHVKKSYLSAGKELNKRIIYIHPDAYADLNSNLVNSGHGDLVAELGDDMPSA